MLRSRARDLRAAGAVLAAALAGAAAGPARAHDPSAGPPLQVVAEPAQLVLGRDAGAELRITTPDDVEDVSVSTSAGRIEDVRKLGAGAFAARFVPPASRVPQVAIVAAVARTSRGTLDGWVAIPCFGQADARVHSAPGGEIALTIGGRRFGPRTAGSDGVAMIPIVVPPGVREAHQGFKPIDLGVPETTLLHAVLDRSVVLADRTERVRVLAWVVAPHGAARRGDAPAFEPTRGTVSVTERQPGEVEGIWTLPPGRAGEERIVVRLATSSASRSVLRLESVAGPPAVIAMSFDRAGVVAGAEEGVGLTARALDAGGNPVRAALALEAEGVSLSDVREPEPGVLVARLRAPAALLGRTEAVVRASAAGAGISGTRTVQLLPGAPARARLDGISGAVRSGRESVLALRVADAGGNPVSPVPAVTADQGKVVAVEAEGPGAWRVRWVAPAVEAPSRARLLATAGGARATLEPVVLPPRPAASCDVSGGAAFDLRDPSAGGQVAVALDFATGRADGAPLGLELAWRAEADVAALRAGSGLALLAGASASRVMGPNVFVRASASGGAWLASGSVAPAARLSLGAGLERRRVAPFVEAALLAASGGADGGFAAIMVSFGLRLGVER